MSHAIVGKWINRIDAEPKVTGAAHFVADMKFPGMLYGKILWSTVAHGNIKKIDVRKAESLPGVKAVITWENVPRFAYCPVGHPYPDDSPQDTYILDKKVRFVGDPVAAVAAESREIAEEAVGLIEVEYEELPAIFKPEDALAENAVEIHEGMNNICGQNEYEFGDTEKGFAQADYIFEDELRTPIVQHCPMENHVSLAYMDEDKRLVVYSATQAPHHLRRVLSDALGRPIGKIRVIKTYVGGGFGGKEDICQEPINAVLAIKTGRPVLLEFSREEEFVSTRTRHSMIFKLKSGLTKDGKFIARRMEILSNTGAYAAHGHNVVYNQAVRFASLYPTPNIAFKGTSVYTNIPIASAMRSYGIAQLCFAMESHVDNIAWRLNMDPIELRRKNVCKAGDTDPVIHATIQTCGLEECIEKGEKLSNWAVNRNHRTDNDSVYKKGLGMACFDHGTGLYPAVEEVDGARIMLNEDASATLFIGSAEIGQGSDTIMAQIAAEELGISMENIKVVAVDTDLCPMSMGALASRQTYVCGMAVKKAAIKCREMILAFAAKMKMLENSSENYDVQNGWIHDHQGRQVISVKDVVWKAYYNKENPTPIASEVYHSTSACPASYGAVFAEVEVDTGTGKIEVQKIWALHDAGKIINHQTAIGQVHGGIFMGLGFGVTEQLLVDGKNGQTLNDNLLDYKIFTTLDMPAIDVTFVETLEPSSAYGNKSLGEPPCVAIAPAIRNAVLNALGVEYNEIPLTPERVLMKLKRTVHP